MRKIIITIFLMMFLTGCSSSVPSSKYNSLEYEYSSLKLEFEEISNQLTKLQDDYDLLLESDGDDIARDKAENFSKILIKSLAIDRPYVAGILNGNMVQINFLAKKDVEDELDYYRNILKDGYDIIGIWGRASDIIYISIKITDDYGSEMFEFSYTLHEKENDISLSIGTKYLEQISHKLLTN